MADQEKDVGAVEQLAMDMGWNPEFEGDEEKPALSAEEYIRKGAEIQQTMRKHLKEQKGKIENLEGTLTDLRMGVDELRSHNERVYKVQVQKLQSELETLKKERRQAIEDGDADQVEEIDKKIMTTQQAAHAAAPAAATQSQDNAAIAANQRAFEEWAKDHSWFNQDVEMTQTAQALANEYQSKGMPYKAMLRKVTRDIKDIYPEQFEASNRTATKAPPSPEGTTTRTAKAGKYSAKDLSSEQRSTMKRFVQMGVMSEAEYIADLAEMGVIGS
jgi:hypothetical protein